MPKKSELTAWEEKELKAYWEREKGFPNSLLQDVLIQGELENLFTVWQESQPPRSGLHASSVLSPNIEFCYREHVLGIKHRRIHPLYTKHINAVFLNGWQLHEKWQKLFQMAEIAVEVETSHVDERWGLHFTPDAIIDLNETRYIVEIKGYRSEVFQKIDHSRPWANSEYRKAHLQANLYMYMLNIAQAIILIENKNTQEIKVWSIRYDEELAAPFIARMDTLNTLVHTFKTEGRLVKRIAECETVESPRAQKCPLRTACFATAQARKKLVAQQTQGRENI